jgi:hypothetical protein
VRNRPRICPRKIGEQEGRQSADDDPLACAGRSRQGSDRTLTLRPAYSLARISRGRYRDSSRTHVRFFRVRRGRSGTWRRGGCYVHGFANTVTIEWRGPCRKTASFSHGGTGSTATRGTSQVAIWRMPARLVDRTGPLCPCALRAPV